MDLGQLYLQWFKYVLTVVIGAVVGAVVAYITQIIINKCWEWWKKSRMTPAVDLHMVRMTPSAPDMV